MAAKLSIPVAHVEAGLRSFDRRMPEEVNRVVADHLSRWLFAPTPTAVANLAAEGIVDGVDRVGDVMQDLAARTVPESASRPSWPACRPGELEPGRLPLRHDPSRGEPLESRRCGRWTDLLGAVASADRPVVLALHPGHAGRARRRRHRLPRRPGDRAAGLPDALALQLHAAAVLTDSGGVQREAAWLGVPCLILRGTTEWVEAVAGSEGRMVVVGLDRDRARRELLDWPRLRGDGVRACQGRRRRSASGRRRRDRRGAGMTEVAASTEQNDRDRRRVIPQRLLLVLPTTGEFDSRT